jgi:hypothetical protein
MLFLLKALPYAGIVVGTVLIVTGGISQHPFEVARRSRSRSGLSSVSPGGRAPLRAAG